MLKKVKSGFIKFLLLPLFFVSCTDNLRNSKETNTKSFYENYVIDDCKSSSEKIALLAVKNVLRADEILQKYNLKDTSRAATSDCDLVTLAKNSVEENICAKEELENLQKQYHENISELIPDYSPAVKKGLLSIDEENKKIIFSDDYQIELASEQGIMMVEFMNLIAEGKEYEEAVDIIQKGVDSVLREDDDARGLFIKHESSGWGHRWENGIVKYTFVTGDDELSDNYKTEMKAAMQDWHDKLKSANNDKEVIVFEEIEPCWWDNLCAGLAQFDYLKIQNKEMKGADGCSTVGAYSFAAGYLYINEKNIDGYKDSYFLNPVTGKNESLYELKFKRVCRHELGHTLGIFHEHQRSDRDSYLEISSEDAGNSNYQIIPDEKLYFAFKVVRILGIRIYIPYCWYGTYSKKVGNFDLDSIMLYSQETLKDDIAKSNGYLYSYTKLNSEISETDIKTVLEIYK